MKRNEPKFVLASVLALSVSVSVVTSTPGEKMADGPQPMRSAISLTVPVTRTLTGAASATEPVKLNAPATASKATVAVVNCVPVAARIAVWRMVAMAAKLAAPEKSRPVRLAVLAPAVISSVPVVMSLSAARVVVRRVP